MSDNIQVAIRVRRLIDAERLAGLKVNWCIEGDSISCVEDSYHGRKPTVYTFDHIFGADNDTLHVFNRTCKQIVDASMNGFNGTIFAYGQSSSGKTHTISGSPTDPGIIALAVNEMFTQIESIKNREYLIRVSYLEIYNEKLTDLLKEDDTNLKLQEDTDRNIRIAGLHEEMVNQRSVVPDILKRGNAKRHTAATKQNDRSSRSHCILRFVIESRVVGEEDEAVKVSNLYFVDLAGSEKAGDNSGDRFREGCSINKSLLALGNVIRKLSGDDNLQHVSYRDSKLTRILQNALGGNSKTAIICTITPAHIEESESTLKFASKAKTVQNKAHVNEVMSEAALLKKYQKMIKSLEKQVQEGQDGSLVKKLQENEAYVKEQEETIKNLRNMIMISGTVQADEPVIKKKRRETWAPGKRGKQRLSIPSSNFASVHFNLEEVIIEEEEQPAEMVGMEEETEIPDVFEKRVDPFENGGAIQVDSTVKELFELQDQHEIALREIKRKDTELEELREYKELERQMQEETITELTNKLKSFEESQPWMEEELMKAQQERNSLRQKVDSLNRQLKSAEQGSGLTEKCEQLTNAQTTIDNLESDMEIQKSRYEFHIEQMKVKIESYTRMLEEKGVDSDYIKQRFSSEMDNNSELAELKTAHEVRINDLQNEIDMLVLSLEREKKNCKALDDKYVVAFEDQKQRFQKDIQERDEEIEIWRKMMEEAVASNDGNQASKADDLTAMQQMKKLQDDKFEKAFEDQKQQFQKDIQERDEEIEIYRKMLEEAVANNEGNQSSNLHDVTTIRMEMKKLQDDYEQKLANLQAQLEQNTAVTQTETGTEVKTSTSPQQESTDLQTELLRAELERLKEIHEEEISQWKIKVEDLMECQQPLKESNDSSNIGNEMESLKKLYEDEIRDLKQKNDILTENLQSKTNGENCEVSEMKVMKDKYEAEIEKLHELLVENKTPENNHSINKEVENLKEKMELMQSEHEAEILKQKEKLESLLNQSENSTKDIGGKSVQSETFELELEKLRMNYESQIKVLQDSYEAQQSKDDETKNVYEKKIQDLIESYEKQLAEKPESVLSEKCNSLESEMLKAEMEEMRDSYEDKIKELNQENLTLQNSGVEQSDNINDLQTELLKAEMEEMKAQYELEIEELKQSSETPEISSETVELKNEYEKKIQDLTESYEKKLEEKSQGSSDDNCTKLETEMLKAEMEEMRGSYEDKIKELKQENLTLQNSVVEQSGNINDLQTELLKAEMEEMKAKYELEIEELGQSSKRYETTIKEIGEELAIFKASIKKLSDDIEQLQAANKSLKKDKIDLLNEKTEVEKELEVYKEALDELKVALKEAESENLKLTENESVELKEKLEQMEEHAKLTTELISEYETQIEELKVKQKSEENSENSELKETIDKMEKDSKLANELISEYETQIEELKVKQKSEENSENSELKETIDKIEKDSRLANELISEYETQIEELKCKQKSEEQSEISELKEKIDKMERDSKLANELISEYETQIEELKMKQYEISELKEKIDKMERDGKLANELISEYETQIEELHAKQKSEEQSQITELKEKIVKMEEHSKLTSELISEYETEIENLKEKQKSRSESETCDLKIKLVKMEEECKLTNELISEYETEIEVLKEKLRFKMEEAQTMVTLDEMRKMEEDLKEKLNDVRNEKEHLESEINDVREDRNREMQYLKDELAKTKEVFINKGEVEDKMNMMEKENSQLRLQIQEISDEKREKQQTIELHAEIIEELKENLKQTEKDLSEVTSKYDILQEMKNNSSKVDVERIDSLEKENNHLKEVVSKYRYEIDELKEHISTLSVEKESSQHRSKEVLEALEKENCELKEEILQCNKEIQELRTRVSSMSVGAEKIRENDRVTELEKENSQLKEQLKSLEVDMAQAKQRIESLQEDNEVLENNLPPQAVKYHSLPANFDWEEKWEAFVKEEKLKRRVMGMKIRELNTKIRKYDESQMARLEDAIKISNLTDELLILKKEMKEMETDKTKNQQNLGYVTGVDHSCQYRQDCVRLTSEKHSIQEELDSRKQRFHEVAENYEQRIAKLKNEIRRLNELDKTFDVGSLKQPNFTSDKSFEEVSSQKIVSDSSQNGGVVEHYTACLLQAENKRLKKDLEKAEKNLVLLEILKKENVSLKENLSVSKSVEKEKVDDRELVSTSGHKQVLGDMAVKAQTPNTSEITVSSGKKEDKFDISDLFKKPDPVVFKRTTGEKARTVSKKKEEEDKCKTS